MSEQVTFIIVGATGDLARRRLFPALYALYKQKKVQPAWLIIGVGLEEKNPTAILEATREFVEEHDEQSWQQFCALFYYHQTDFSHDTNVAQLAHRIDMLEQERGQKNSNRLIYLAIPPQFFAPVTQRFAQNTIIKKNTATTHPWYRVVYEKPFGLNKTSAHDINTIISEYLNESQIFRVDHYLAKDLIGTITLLRFTNRIFEPLWNKDNIAWVEITLRETLGVGQRGTYYDHYGALKDIVQNHLLQIVALLAMEAPQSLTGNMVRDEKAKILAKINPVDGILGQYEGYHEEPNIKHDSTTETFAAIQLRVDTPRWQGVPFYVTTGKCLTTKETRITIQFKPVACLLSSSCPSTSNTLTIRVIPEPGFSLELNVKKPGLAIEVIPVTMDFCYECILGSVKKNTYELVLEEVLLGEQSISVRFDEIEYAWDVIEKIKKLSLPLYHYPKGTKGPIELEQFAEKHNMRWQS